MADLQTVVYPVLYDILKMELPEIMEGINYIAWMKPKQYFF